VLHAPPISLLILSPWQYYVKVFILFSPANYFFFLSSLFSRTLIQCSSLCFIRDEVSNPQQMKLYFAYFDIQAFRWAREFKVASIYQFNQSLELFEGELP
jgi:hypothetical protein